MPYTPYHADWKDFPDTTTPITAAALEYIEAGIVANVGATGATGATGAAGTGAASLFDAQLGAGAAAGATTITMDRSATSAIQDQGWLVVDAFTSQAEVMKINSHSGRSQ